MKLSRRALCDQISDRHTEEPMPRVELMLVAALWSRPAWRGAGAADPGRYPEVAQLPASPARAEFIHLEQLVAEIVALNRPLIVDVRSREEYLEGHIRGSVSIPLSEIPQRLGEIPRDRTVVLY
jgi:3-mercaptopyruvate sulfurtransferase SseA